MSKTILILFKVIIIYLFLSLPQMHVAKTPDVKVKAKAKSADFPKIFNEDLLYRISWMEIGVGQIDMKTRFDERTQLLAVDASVSSWPVLNTIYYVSGSFGTQWDFKQRRSIRTYEEIYQGKIYIKRDFVFAQDYIVVRKYEERLAEYSWPHDGPRQKVRDYTKVRKSSEHQDLLGALYHLRSLGRKLEVGMTDRFSVLPAGNLRQLVLQVLGQERIATEPFGLTDSFKVKTAIFDPLTNRIDEHNIFFKTKASIIIWISNDGNYLPLRMTTQIPYMGSIQIELVSYRQG